MVHLDHRTDDALDQADAKILTFTFSDDVLEASAGSRWVGFDSLLGSVMPYCEVCGPGAE